MKINWSIRIKSLKFWTAIIPAVLLLVQVVLALFDINWDFNDLNGKLLTIVNAAFGVLVIIGVVVDPTTPGLNDSERAMTYGKDE